VPIYLENLKIIEGSTLTFEGSTLNFRKIIEVICI
tara:strand:+ start:2740 stop:2844 length:105 start_codon:yes stop_codon:yes gene_type:complete